MLIELKTDNGVAMNVYIDISAMSYCGNSLAVTDGRVIWMGEKERKKAIIAHISEEEMDLLERVFPRKL